MAIDNKEFKFEGRLVSVTTDGSGDSITINLFLTPSATREFTFKCKDKETAGKILNLLKDGILMTKVMICIDTSEVCKLFPEQLPFLKLYYDGGMSISDDSVFDMTTIPCFAKIPVILTSR